MNFCQECGKPLKGAENHCMECGRKVEHVSPQASRSSTSISVSKKNKLIGSIVGAAVILLGAFYFWGSSQVSAQNIAQKFTEAIQTNDANALQKVTIVHHGKFISKGEAKGLLALAKEEPEFIEMNMRSMSMGGGYPDEGLFIVVENGKWLGIFKRHSILVKPQYVELRLPFENVKTTFNGQEVSIKESGEETVVHGPMAPGIYDLDSSFSGEYTEVKTKEKLTVLDEYSDPVPHRVDLEAAYVNLYLDTANAPVSKAHVLINDKKVKFDKEMKIEKFGPLKLDGKTTVVPVVELPWGEIKSEKVKIKNDTVNITPYTINKELTDSLSELILAYGEEYLQAHAAWDTAKFTTITSSMKEDFQSDFSYNRDSDELFTGKLEKIELNLEDIHYNENENNTIGVGFPARFTFQADSYYKGDKPSITERIDSCDMDLLFYKKDNSWKVNGCSSSWFGNDMEPTVTLEGSNKLYSPSNTDGAVTVSKDTEASKGSASEKSSETTGDSDVSAADFEIFMATYNEKSVQALNTNDFSVVEPMIASNGPRLNEQRDYLHYIASKGITEEILSTNVESVSKTGDSTWKVVTIEEFNIHKKDSSSTKKFRTKNVIKRIDGQFQLYELLETKEI